MASVSGHPVTCSFADSAVSPDRTKSLKAVRHIINPSVRNVSLAYCPSVWSKFGMLEKHSKSFSRSSSRIAAIATDAVPVDTGSTPVKEPGAASEPVGERHAYQAEVSKLLDIIVHSLYSHTEVFLRELVSNCSDALDKLRFLSVTEPNLLGSDPELAIKIRADKDQRILVIQDSGIGMTKEDLISSLGTIAQSGTANFLKALKENKDTLGGDNSLIGRFGVGFYSAFLVADKVVVSSKHPKSDKQYVWEAEANSNAFIIREETDAEYLFERGTAVILYLKEDAMDYADPSKIENLVKTYSQFISFPIYVGREKTGATKAPTEEGAEVEKVKKSYSYDLVNETKPIWMRSPREVTKEEYHAFFKKTYDERLDPMAYTHFNTEGEVEFKSLLYIPGMAPFASDEASSKLENIKLYVKRVLISDDFHGELFPRYLSFIKGVVDSNDLPSNVSRELLQESCIVNLMRERLTKETFDLFESIAKRTDKEDYNRFWRNYGKYIKLGVTDDKDNQKRLAYFLRYHSSTHQEEMTSLKDYVDNMKEGQEFIYYFSSESVKSGRNAPLLEKLVEKGYEVLFLTEPMDEVSVNALKSFKGKDFVDVSKEDFDLATIGVWQSAEAVCFDVDSTVCMDEGIDALGEFCGAGEAVAAWTVRAMGGSVPFEEALAARLSLFKPSLKDVERYLASNPPKITPGVEELTKKLHSKGKAVYLISGGFRQMIAPVAKILQIPEENVFANKLLFDENGNYTGFDIKEPTSKSGGKAAAIAHLKQKCGYNKLVMIGDGATDLEARQPGGADIFICYGGVQFRAAVAAQSDWCVLNFRDLIESI